MGVPVLSSLVEPIARRLCIASEDISVAVFRAHEAVSLSERLGTLSGLADVIAEGFLRTWATRDPPDGPIIGTFRGHFGEADGTRCAGASLEAGPQALGVRWACLRAALALHAAGVRSLEQLLAFEGEAAESVRQQVGDDGQVLLLCLEFRRWVQERLSAERAADRSFTNIAHAHPLLRHRLGYLAFLLGAGVVSDGEAMSLLSVYPWINLGPECFKPGLEIVWELPGELVAINKPSDLRIDLPDGGSAERKFPEEYTVADWFVGDYSPGVQKIRFCHQLDHATSGVLLMALTKRANAAVGKLFETRGLRKRYLAIVVGWPDWDERFLDWPIADVEEGGFARHVDFHVGQPAQTHARVLQRGMWGAGHGNGGRFRAALIALQPHTGRRHQLRVHLAHAGFPILGDAVYGETRREVCGGAIPVPRMMLHAEQLELPGSRVWGPAAVVIKARCNFAEQLTNCSDILGS